MHGKDHDLTMTLVIFTLSLLGNTMVSSKATLLQFLNGLTTTSCFHH